MLVQRTPSGDVATNERYLRALVLDSLGRGEAPFASHGFYTRYLDDTVRPERRLGMECGFAWAESADLIVVGVDLGISSGMEEGISRWQRTGKPIEHRSLDGWPKAEPRQQGLAL